jgi:uncharacterized membrane protein
MATTATAATPAQQTQATSPDPLRHHVHRKKQPSRAERVAMGVAQATGTVQFLAIGLVVIAGWFAINGVVPFAEHTIHALEHGGEFDPAPWILLNLIFSFEAFFTGSLVIIAARASALREEEREQAEATHREELAQRQTELLVKNTELTEQIHVLSEQLSVLTQELHTAICTRAHPSA